MIRVAAVQMTSTADFDSNLRVAEALMQEAALQGATLVLLPENFALYGAGYRQLAEARGEDIQAWLSHWARTLKVTLIGGTIPLTRRPDGSVVSSPRVRAACLIHTPTGELCARYDKLHLFDVAVADAQGRYCESDVFEPGDRAVVARVQGLSIGMAVCYDLRFALLAAWLRQAGAQLLVYPSAFTQVTGRAHWEVLLRSRAVENGCYVLAAAQCGQHNEKRYSFGHSMLVDPWGRIVAHLEDQPGVLVADLDLDLLAAIRRDLPVHTHQRFSVELPDGIRSD